MLLDIEKSIAIRKEQGKLVHIEVLNALNDTRDKVIELENRLTYDFQKIEAPKIDYDVETIINEESTCRAKAYREIQSVIEGIMLRRNKDTDYMLIKYKNKAIHLIVYENKTGEVVSSSYVKDSHIDVYGDFEPFKSVVCREIARWLCEIA